ncbi:11730_t:CDS:2, partial [Racocetra fulgida]
CSLDSVRKLEVGDYKVKNKEQMIKELRAALTTNSESQLLESFYVKREGGTITYLMDVEDDQLFSSVIVYYKA